MSKLMSSSASKLIGVNFGEHDVSGSTKTMTSDKHSLPSLTGALCEVLVPKSQCRDAVPFWKSEVAEGRLIIWNLLSEPR